ncbi:uncharacterized protein LOC130745841 [Lotus japonicus]|uniref:uncharacterized protein LOC130745841 n=1 Tax=Lotus japonicus TaxID=34305 RepID=UPI00258D3F4D|nr:uncharacterized protein LOC130745841 [Lotus japonicus]
MVGIPLSGMILRGGEGTKLNLKYKRMFDVSNQQQNPISDMGLWVDGGWVWRFNWRRALFVWEVKLLDELTTSLQNFKPVVSEEDKWVWVVSEGGGFSVASAYKYLQDQGLVEVSKAFEALWKIPAPSNVLAFAWKALLDRIQSRENLRKRNIIAVGQVSLCLLCQEDEESTGHVLFSCKRSWEVWMWCYNWWGIQTALPHDCKGHFEQHVSVGRRSVGIGWLVVWCSCIWAIWLARNQMVFKHAVNVADKERLTEVIKLKSWIWLRGKLKGFSYSFYEWSTNPKVCLEGAG